MSKFIYTFTIDKVAKVSEKRVEKYTDDQGNEKERSISEEVEKKIPVEIQIRKPTRKQMQEAEMVFSIEMSRCIKAGILTKAMLMNKYSDTGGMLSESDAKALSKMYGELSVLQTEFTQLNLKSNKDQDKLNEVSEKMANLRRSIATAETNFSALLNHTADTRAQNKVITWYLLNLTHTEKDEEKTPFFEGETFEEKKLNFYEMEENEDPLFTLVYDKLTAFISFWYFSANTTSKDFEELEQDIEEGKL